MGTPIYFTPTTSKHQGVLCGGIHLHITDEKALEPVKLGVLMLDLLRRMYPDDFQFLPPVLIPNSVKQDFRPLCLIVAKSGPTHLVL